MLIEIYTIPLIWEYHFKNNNQTCTRTCYFCFKRQAIWSKYERLLFLENINSMITGDIDHITKGYYKCTVKNKKSAIFLNGSSNIHNKYEAINHCYFIFSWILVDFISSKLLNICTILLFIHNRQISRRYSFGTEYQYLIRGMNSSKYQSIQ